MAKETHKAFIGTHARLTLSDCNVLAKLIAKHSKLIKEHSNIEPEEDFSPSLKVLSQREIEDAINGPLQAFFKHKITAYTKMARLRLHITMTEDESLKDKRTLIDEGNKIPERILTNTSLSDLSRIQYSLDELTTQHEEQWEAHRHQWVQQILQRLGEQGLQLSDIELKEFIDPEPISELLDRFTTLNIDLPKVETTDMNFSKYFTLKADITIQSALSRQHLPHSQQEIQKILGKLKSDFNAIAKQETQLLKEQEAATHETVANISW